jgi:hypothetical protein
MLTSALKIALPSVVILTGLGLTTMRSYAKPEYTKSEKKSCTYCHTGAGKKELNDVGKCYAAHDHKLDACAPK